MFNKQYICLVAGLREYALDADTRALNLSELLQEIYMELSSSDAESVKLLYGFYDCENIASLFAGRSNFNPLGQLSREQIEAILRGAELSAEVEKGLLPNGVIDVIEAYSTKGGVASDMDMSQSFERSLFTAYYLACNNSSSSYLKRWSEADRNLRNVAAAINARLSGRAIEQVVVGDGGVVEQLVRSSAADFGLRGELNYLDIIISAINDESNIVEKERKIDMIRWDLAEELSEGEYFSINFVLAYLSKINIIARWSLLNAERGREMFAKLMSELSGKDLINK